MQKCLLRSDFLLSELRFVNSFPRSASSSSEPSHVVLFEPGDNRIQLSAAIGAGYAQSVIPVVANCPSSPSFAISAKALIGLLENVRGPRVIKLSTLNDWALFGTDKGQWRYKILPQAEAIIQKQLASFESMKLTRRVELHGLKSLLGEVSGFVAKQATGKFNFEVVYLTIDSSGCRTAACDGAVGFHSPIQPASPIMDDGDPIKVAVPKNFVAPLREITPFSTDAVSVDSGDEAIHFTCPPRSVVFRNTNTDPPRLERLLSVAEGSTQIDLVAEELYAAVRRVRVAAHGSIRKVCVSIKPGSDLLVQVESTFGDVVNFEEDVCAKTSGQATFSVNTEPLTKFLRKVSGPLSIYVPENDRVPVIFMCSSGHVYSAMQVE